MTRITNYFRNKLIDICRILVQEKYQLQDDNVKRLESMVTELIKNNENLSNKLTNINRLLKVGIDINPLPELGSWAVICFKDGKRERVNFYSLSNTNYREVKDFISWFEQNNVIVDTDLSSRDYFRSIFKQQGVNYDTRRK